MPVPLGTKYFVFPYTNYRSTNYNVDVKYCQIFCILFYGYEIWRLISSDRRRLEILGNRVRRKIFEPDREEVTPPWKQFRKKRRLSDLRSSRNIVRLIKYERIKLMGIVANNGENVNAYKILWGSLKLGMKCKFNLSLRRLRATIVAVENNKYYIF